MTSSNVDFYEQIKQLQEKQHESERKRMEMDQSLNNHMNSEPKMSKLKATRLQNYWRKICDDEKKSQLRNEQLILDIEKMEKHMSILSERTQKLMMVKRQYEEYIERMYPNWQEKVMHYQRVRQEADKQRTTAPSTNYFNPPQMQPYTTPSAQPAVPTYASVQREEINLGHQENAPSTMQTVATIPTAEIPPPQHEMPPQKRVESTPPSPRKPTPSPREGTKTPRESSVGSRRQSKDIETAVEQESLHESEDDFSVASIHHSHKSISPSPTPRSLSHNSPASRKSPDPVAREIREETHEENYLRPDVTFEGLDNMLTAIEDDFPHAHLPDEFYRTKTPPLSMRKEIIANANRGIPLSYMDGSSISMAVLDQLPLLVYYSCDGGYLLSDSLIYRPPYDLTEENLREKIHPTCHSFWGRLYVHFVQLIKYEIMSPEEVASHFAPLLIGEDSPHEEKAKQLLTALLESVDPEDVLHSPNSTSTFSTLPSPRKPKQHVTIPRENDTLQDEDASDGGVGLSKKLSDASNRAPLHMPDVGKEEEEVESPSIQENEPPEPPKMNTRDTPLTQTAAYRQLLGDTISSQQKTMSYEASDDSSDEIENQLGLTSPRNQAIREEPSGVDDEPPKTDLSATAPVASKPSWFSDMQRPATATTQPTTQPPPAQISKDDFSDNDLDPASTGGYQPSALGNTGRSDSKPNRLNNQSKRTVNIAAIVSGDVDEDSSTFSLASEPTALSSTTRSLGSAAKTPKKPAFMFGDSDTEDDVSLPGGRKNTLGSDRDDFDFYG